MTLSYQQCHCGEKSTVKTKTLFSFNILNQKEFLGGRRMIHSAANCRVLNNSGVQFVNSNNSNNNSLLFALCTCQ